MFQNFYPGWFFAEKERIFVIFLFTSKFVRLFTIGALYPRFLDLNFFSLLLEFFLKLFALLYSWATLKKRERVPYLLNLRSIALVFLLLKKGGGSFYFQRKVGASRYPIQSLQSWTTDLTIFFPAKKIHISKIMSIQLV